MAAAITLMLLAAVAVGAALGAPDDPPRDPAVTGIAPAEAAYAVVPATEAVGDAPGATLPVAALDGASRATRPFAPAPPPPAPTSARRSAAAVPAPRSAATTTQAPPPTTPVRTSARAATASRPAGTTQARPSTTSPRITAPVAVSGGSLCEMPGAKGITPSGNSVTCTRTNDGRYRWKK